MRRIQSRHALIALLPLAAVLPAAACSSNGAFTSSGDDASVDDASSPDGTVDGDTDGGILPGIDGSSDSGQADAPSDALVDVWDGYDGFTCDPNQEPITEPCVISGDYGVFVAPGGSSSAAGTEAAPVDSIATALVKAQSESKHLIFVCGGTYTGAVAIASSLSLDVSIYGGLSCPSSVGGDAGGSAWAYTGAPTTVTTGSFTPALTVIGATHAVTIEDVAFTSTAATGVDSNGAGSSSIAGWVANATTVSFKRVGFTAGAGAAGVAGAMYTDNYTTDALNGKGPMGGAGGLECDSTCGDSATSTGGFGGNGGVASASAGNPGASNPVTTPTIPIDNGGGGDAATSTNLCGVGHPGASGAAVGVGAGATTLGVLSATGWSPTPGGAPTANGDPGQGGGGGGGSFGSIGGGGGACGGCGGGKGQGGTGAGSSFALVVVSSTVQLASTTLTSGNGGIGGAGSAGEQGQAGGTPGLSAGCSGGAGGAGAGGSGGGGGAGGSSVGLAWTGSGTSVTIDGTAVSTDIATASYFTGGSLGAGGALGSGGAAANSSGAAGANGTAGVNGVVDAVKQF